ncbi:OmpA/MotB family protein [Formosa agariphila KMM 3901]|uniref:OmpA/MotB family protein n=1 Tax=Formosa agariphila (strain DSM 15362 / KCTC 12365 / LMG 23005 / KMM 3901 / M-2Alg 35-1) TaxID=1347342 RepID=T2KSB0_FORAG|nr:OmpA family protein [Formosa agariphila]CDF81104.1 OmpA/MotB family protein [Formosa agariphila KMM 3901]
MSKKAVYLLGILLTIILGTILYCNLCTTCCVQEEIVAEPVVVEPKAATMNPFLLNDSNGDLKLNVNDNINFKASGITILTPISSSVENAIDSLKVYLDANPLKTIGITGLYTSEETNNSAFPNLGLARANAVKNYYVSKGISSQQIDTFGTLQDSMIPDQDSVYYGPENYSISTRDESDNSHLDALQLIKDEIEANPLVMYFDTAKASISLSAEQREKVAKISRYLDKVEGATTTIVGHTDNTGNADSNVVLGQERADFAKSYFIRNHIPESKITTLSKGQTEPIADNDTEDGRAKNRRTIVILN